MKPFGIPCPNCGDGRIRISINELLYGENPKCPKCGNKVTIDTSTTKRIEKMVGSLEAMRSAAKAERGQSLD